MDLGAGPWRTFWQVTLPQIAPGVLAAALLVFALSIDDYVITSFVAGVGTTTLPVQIYSMVRRGHHARDQRGLHPAARGHEPAALRGLPAGAGGARAGRAALPALLGLAILAAPFVLGRGASEGERVLNLYIWSNYIAPETVKKFEERYGVRVNLDLYDTNEALLAKVQAGNVPYDVLCPSNYVVEILARQDLLAPARPLARCRTSRNLDPRFSNRDYDPGNRHSVPYFWGTAGIGYRKSAAGTVDSWAALWDDALQGPGPDARRPPRDPRGRPQVEGPQPQHQDQAELREAQRAARSCRSRS